VSDGDAGIGWASRRSHERSIEGNKPCREEGESAATIAWSLGGVQPFIVPAINGVWIPIIPSRGLQNGGREFAAGDGSSLIEMPTGKRKA